MVFNLPRTSSGAKSQLLTMLLWRKAFRANKIVLFFKKKERKNFVQINVNAQKKNRFEVFFLSFWNISMFFQLLLPLPKLDFKIDLPYCTSPINKHQQIIHNTTKAL